MATTFISYSHDSVKHKSVVLTLANRLVQEGVDCDLDQYHESPPEGWPKWMLLSIKEADFVLVVCTETYLDRIEDRTPVNDGLGAKWEGGIITQELYERGGRNDKFIPVITNSNDKTFIPPFLRSATYYDISQPERYDRLYRQITNQPAVVKPPLGRVKKLEPLDATSPGVVDVNQVSSPSRDMDTNEEDFVLLIAPGEPPVQILVELIEAQIESTCKLVVAADDEPTAAAVSHLSSRLRSEVWLAFGNTGQRTVLTSGRRVRQQGRDTWNLEFNRIELGGSMEMAYSGTSADQLALMKANWILLNEHPLQKMQHLGSDFEQEMFLHVLRGTEVPLKVQGSPFPNLYHDLGAQQSQFLTVAKLYAVLWLVLSCTVEQVQNLQLTMSGVDTLHVDFLGKRKKVFGNVDPPTITVQGKCELTMKPEAP